VAEFLEGAIGGEMLDEVPASPMRHLVGGRPIFRQRH